MNSTSGYSVKKRCRLLAGIIAINISVVTLLVVSVVQGYFLRIQQAEISSKNISGILNLYFSEKFKEIDLTLLAVRDELESQMSAGSIIRGKANKFFSRHQTRLPESDSLRFADENGIIRIGTGVSETGPAISIRDRDYFRALKADPARNMVFSSPVIGRISKKWVIIFARSVSNPDGSFAGVVYSPVTLEYLTGVFSSLNVGSGGVFTMFDRDGLVYARYPEIHGGKERDAQRITNPIVLEQIKAGRDSFSYRSPSSLDGIDRFFSVKQITGYPLYIVAGLSAGHYMKPWERDASVLISLSVLFMVFSFFFVWQIQKGWDQLEKTRSSLEDALVNVRMLSGLLPICASCKRIRDDNGYWNQIEIYIRDHSEADFSHSLCPDCARKLYPDVYPEINKNGE